jgi:hypothetical protein
VALGDYALNFEMLGVEKRLDELGRQLRGDVGEEI